MKLPWASIWRLMCSGKPGGRLCGGVSLTAAPKLQSMTNTSLHTDETLLPLKLNWNGWWAMKLPWVSIWQLLCSGKPGGRHYDGLSLPAAPIYWQDKNFNNFSWLGMVWWAMKHPWVSIWLLLCSGKPGGLRYDGLSLTTAPVTETWLILFSSELSPVLQAFLYAAVTARKIENKDWPTYFSTSCPELQ